MSLDYPKISWRSRVKNSLSFVWQLRNFLLFWLSQSLSQIGTALTSFGLGIWIYQQTEVVSQLSLVFFITTLPGVLLTSSIGVLVDRGSRRWIIFFSDCFAALLTLLLFLLLFQDRLLIWHTYLFAFFTSLCGCFQMVAKGAAVPMMVEREQLRQVNGMLQLSNAISSIAAPALAGILIARLEIEGLLALDLVSYAIGAIALLFISIPDPEIPGEDKFSSSQKRSPLLEIQEAGKIIVSQGGFIVLIAAVSLHSFMKGLINVLLNPLILSFSNTETFGTIMSLGSTGMVIGSILLSLWANREHPLVFLMVWSGVSGIGLMLAGVHPSVITIAAGIFIWFLALPFIFGTNQTIWQSYVQPHFQGRVLSLVGSLTGLATALGTISASPLADRILEPLMSEKSWLADIFGSIFGMGRGRGIGLLVSFEGVIVSSVSIAAILLVILWPRFNRSFSLEPSEFWESKTESLDGE